MVRFRQDRGGVFQHVAPATDVERDDVHRLADGDDRVANLLGHPLGRAVTGAGLIRRDGRIGNQLHVGAHDAARVAVKHHRAVHLGQFTQPRG